MTKTSLINSSMAALATAVIFTVSLSSANAGWGSNGQYGNTPTPRPTQSAPAQVPVQTGGYGGQSRPTGTWGSGGPAQATGTYGSGTQQTNNYPNRERPCRRCDRPYVPAQTYNERPSRGSVYIPPNRGTVYVPQSGVTYNNGGGYNPNRGTVYVPPKRDTWSNGSGYGGSQSQSSSDWNASGGYGGR